MQDFCPTRYNTVAHLWELYTKKGTGSYEKDRCQLQLCSSKEPSRIPSEQLQLISQWPKLSYTVIPGYKRILRKWVILCRHIVPQIRIRALFIKGKKRMDPSRTPPPSREAPWLAQGEGSSHCIACSSLPVLLVSSSYSLLEAFIMLRLSPWTSELKLDLDLLFPLFPFLPVDILCIG